MQYKYVFKALKPDLHEGEHNKGTVDLAVEARFLATFSHKHILAMRATADVDQLEPNFFVVLDRLEVTLDKKLQDWRKRCLLYTSPSPRDRQKSRMPSSA